jgi:glycosyltransferase involved in cell wall biosynthesis
VLSSSHAVAKGVLTGPDQCHVSYVHSPLRYAWDLQHAYLAQSALGRGPVGALVRWQLHKLRQWDRASAAGVDRLLANSQFVRRRIRKAYRREAQVLYPPVQVEAFDASQPRQDYYVTLSRLVPYKRVPLIIEAFAQLGQRRLVVIGDGPEMARCQRLAAGYPQIELVGRASGARVRQLLQQARACVFAAEEDFGIAPVEAQAAGCPVIAYGRGGCLETVQGPQAAAPTGLWFDQQTPQALIAAVQRFEALQGGIDPLACRRNAERFSAAVFRAGLQQQVALALEGCR